MFPDVLEKKKNLPVEKESKDNIKDTKYQVVADTSKTLRWGEEISK